MTADEAFALAEERAWAQTKALLGPMPWHGDQPEESFDQWISQRDEFWNEIVSELIEAGIVDPFEERLRSLET